MVQDASGVVFRALDTETDRTVAVRRFFPFGAAGGGLREDEQIAYMIAVERLARIDHPALRSIICGGCDPVDGMPYIATEWIEGPRLKSLIERGPLDPAEAANLLTQALEVCEVLSEVLAEEAVWVETGLNAIVVGAEDSGRGVTFWIAPLKWLGKNDGQRGLESIITLTEEVLGWAGKTVPDHAGNGLGGWLKWLRGAAKTASLQQARENLAASLGVGPPIHAKRLLRQATRSLESTPKKNPARWPFFVLAAMALMAIALGGFFMIRRNNAANVAMLPLPQNAVETVSFEIAPEPAAPVSESFPNDALAAATLPATSGSEEKGVAQVNREAAVFYEEKQETERRKATRRSEIQQRGDVFEVTDRELLLENKSAEVKLEGRLEEVRFSNNGKGVTLYLEFSKPSPKDEPRGVIPRENLTSAINEDSLRKFIGKKVRLTGKVKGSRPEIEINPAAIQEVP